MNKNEILCGVSEVVITPALGGAIPGYYEERLSVDKFDDLYAKAVVFSCGDDVSGIIELDVCYFLEEHMDAVRTRIERLLGISAEHITVAATHTHTGANIDTTGHDVCHATDAEIQAIIDRAADAAVYAYRRRQPFKIGFGRTELYGVSFNRRWWMKDGAVHTWPGINNPDNIRPAAGIDPEVAVVRIDTPDGEPIAVLTNFANHLDCAGGGYKYCADYPGELSRQVKNALGHDVVSIFMNGCCGDITHVDYSGEYPLIENQHVMIGRKLADAVLGVYGKVNCDAPDVLKAVKKTIEAKRRQFTKEQYDDAILKIAEYEKTLSTPREKIDQSDDEFAKPTTGDVVIQEMSYAYAAKELYEHPIMSETLKMHAIRVGDIVFSTMPGEIFHELGLDLKKRSPFGKNFIVELANGYHSYIATEKAYSEGGYETTFDFYMNLVPGTGERIVDTLLEAHGEL